MLGDHLINFEGILRAMAEQADAVDSKSTEQHRESSNLSSPTKTSACRKTAEFLYASLAQVNRATVF